MSKPANCLVCGTPLTQPATGRPRWYCKRACHQVAELERRRIVTRLATLDTYASNLRLMAATSASSDALRTRSRGLPGVWWPCWMATRRGLHRGHSPARDRADSGLPSAG
jgi:hypothetical protein